MNGPLVIAINDLGFGGGQRTVLGETNELTQRGITVYVLMTLPTPSVDLLPELTCPKERVIQIPFQSYLDVTAYFKLREFFHEVKPRVVISNLFYTNTVIRIGSMFLPHRVVVREGNVAHEKSLSMRLIELILSLFTYRMIANAQALIPSLRTSYLFTRRSVLPNGVSQNFFEPEEPSNAVSRKKKLGIPEGSVVILCAAALVPKKGHRDLIDAFSRLTGSPHLLIAGSGHLRQELERYARERGVLEQVHFLGGVTDMARIYHMSDMFVLSSHWEGVPNVILEAMASGLPVVATLVGGISEIITEGENGFLVAPGDIDALEHALSKFAMDAGLRRKVGETARSRAREFTWQKHADRLLELI